MLANLALDGMERLLKEQFPHRKVNLVRYADDFLITGPSQEVLEQEVKPVVVEFLRDRGLELSEEKTKITQIKDGLDFLGHHIRKYNGKYLGKPSKKNVQAFLDKVRQRIKANKPFRSIRLDFRASSVVLPELGTNCCQFSLWFVRIGEAVREGDRLAEVNFPGAVVDIAAPADGVLVERTALAGDEISTGQLLGTIETPAES